MTKVVAALIRDGERFLICQRPAHKARGLLWEFVGGKVEPGETKEQALVRECREELDITVEPLDVYMEVVHAYPDLTVRLTLFDARIASGVPKKLEHNDLRWILPEEIPLFPFCPADETILDRIQADCVRKRIESLRDADYQAFHSALLPTVPPESVRGVRIPVLRKLARELSGKAMGDAFLRILPHGCYEENLLHGFLLERLREPQAALEALERFLPYIDNWAVCDSVNPKALAKRPDELLAHIRVWLMSTHPYTVRYGVGMLQRYFLDERFDPELLALAAALPTGEYYVETMTAWFFATALAKQERETLPYFTESNLLPPSVRRKAVRKALESRRISEPLKRRLRALRETEKT